MNYKQSGRKIMGKVLYKRWLQWPYPEKPEYVLWRLIGALRSRHW